MIGRPSTSPGADRARTPAEDEQRERVADSIGDRLDMPMTAAGVVFLLLVLAETVSRPTGTVSTVFSITSWVLWAAFVAEFVLRLAIAPSWTFERNASDAAIAARASTAAAGDT